jgi:hypothetical protein
MVKVVDIFTPESHQFSQQHFGIDSGWQTEGHPHSSFLFSKSFSPYIADFNQISSIWAKCRY